MRRSRVETGSLQTTVLEPRKLFVRQRCPRGCLALLSGGSPSLWPLNMGFTPSPVTHGMRDVGFQKRGVTIETLRPPPPDKG